MKKVSLLLAFLLLTQAFLPCLMPPAKAAETELANVALNQPVFSSQPLIDEDLITDGSIETGYSTSIYSDPLWVAVDLGTSTALDSIILWHYYADGRSYNDVIVQVSDDSEFRSDVVTLFNNDATGELGQGMGSNSPYAESAAGLTVDASGNTARYVRVWSNGNNVNTPAANQITELQVMGRPAQRLLSANAPVTSNDPAISNLPVITNGSASLDAYASTQTPGLGSYYVQLDLGDSFALSQVKVWFYWGDGRSYFNPLIVASTTADFSSGNTIVYNGDKTNAAGFGAGSKPDIRPADYGANGFSADVPGGAKGRYVRVYATGNSVNQWVQWCGVEVLGFGVKNHYGFDPSPAAQEARRTDYDVPGIAQLSDPQRSMLSNGEVISFFGDSITWLGFMEKGSNDFFDGDGYATILKKAIAQSGKDVTLNMRGSNGARTCDLLNGFPSGNPAITESFSQALDTDKTTIAVIYIGINDATNVTQGDTVTVADYRANLRQMIDTAKAKGVTVVLCTPGLYGELPNGKNRRYDLSIFTDICDDKIDQYADVVRDLAHAYGLPLVDIRKAAISYLQNNNFHLDGNGMITYPSRFVDGAANPNGFLTYDGIHFHANGMEFLANLIGNGIQNALVADTNLVPIPQQLAFTGGTYQLSSSANITYTDTGDQDPYDRGLYVGDLAGILAQELYSTTGIAVSVKEGTAAAGGIALVLDPTLNENGRTDYYELNVTDRITVKAATYAQLAAATASVVQLLGTDGNCRQLAIRDWSQYQYRGMMIDNAREYNSVDAFRSYIDLCRLYKVKYLQVHLSDDQGFTFPVSAYPRLNDYNLNGPKDPRQIVTFSLDEWRELEMYSQARGVTIIPEMDSPGHSAVFQKAYPELFAPKVFTDGSYDVYVPSSTINMGSPQVVAAIQEIVTEMLAVFKSTPYFHLGADECDYTNLFADPSSVQRFKDWGLLPSTFTVQQNPNNYSAQDKATLFNNRGGWSHELYLNYLREMYDFMKTRGKNLIVWEGFGESSAITELPKDLNVMMFDCVYNAPDVAVDGQGYNVINACWEPLYVIDQHKWSTEQIYSWNIKTFTNFWPTMRSFTPIVVEDKDNVIQGGQVSSWEQPETWQIDSLRQRVAPMAERVWNSGTVTGYNNFYSRYAATDQLLERLLYPVAIGAVGIVNAPEFVVQDAAPSAYFTDQATVTLSSVQGGSIHYTVTNGSTAMPATAAEPTVSSAAYSGPFSVTAGRTVIKAALFDDDGNQVGHTKVLVLSKETRVVSLTTGKPSGSSHWLYDEYPTSYATDGVADSIHYWRATRAPQSLTIDLLDTYTMDQFQIFGYVPTHLPNYQNKLFDYAYTIEVSKNGESWMEVVHQDNAFMTLEGRTHTVSPVSGRYIRVTMLGTTVEPFHFVGISDFRAFEAQGSDIASPVADQAPGRYPEAIEVALSTSTAGAEIYYTVDGSAPTTGGTLYTGPITVDHGLTLKAVAKLGGIFSMTTSFTYRIGEAPVIPPLASSTLRVGEDLLPDGKAVIGVQPGTSAAQLASAFTNTEGTVVVTDAKGTSGSSAVVGTGAVVTLQADGEILDSATVVIYGDLDGNGRIDSADKTIFARYFAGWKLNLSPANLLALDVNKDGKVDGVDKIFVARFFDNWTDWSIQQS